MGNCCSDDAFPGPCPALPPPNQCSSTFSDQCVQGSHVCAKIEQSEPLEVAFGVCADIPCCVPSIGEWFVDVPSNSCSTQATCSPVNFSLCNVGDRFFEACAGDVGGNISTTMTSTLPITCKWSIDDFNSLEMINEWESKFKNLNSENKKVFDTQIMPHFCSQAQLNTPNNTVCPTNNNEGPNAWVGGICSPFVSTNAVGGKCQSWLKGLGDSDSILAANKTLNGYCENLKSFADNNPSFGLKNGEVNECLCINRGEDPTGLFSQITNAVNSNPETRDEANSLGAVGCWYGPCNAGINQILPLNNGTEPDIYPKNCPNVCKIINNIKGTLTNVKVIEDIKCNDSAPITPNQGGKTNGGNGDKDGDNGNESFWDKYKWWVIGISISIIVIIFIFIIIIYVEDKKG